MCGHMCMPVLHVKMAMKEEFINLEISQVSKEDLEGEIDGLR